jgi:hypothetical protein
LKYRRRSKKITGGFQYVGKKGRGLGDFCSNAFRVEGAVVCSEVFQPFGVKQNTKAKQFSIPFKKNLAGGL